MRQGLRDNQVAPYPFRPVSALQKLGDQTDEVIPMKILTPEEVDDIAGRHSGERLPSPDSNIKIADLITTIYSAWQEMKTYEPSNGYMIVCLSGGRYCEVNDPAIVEALKLREIYNEEVEEFNAGVEAFKAGKSIDDEPGDLKQDQWRVGYAFAAFDILKRDSEALKKLGRERNGT